jgi:dipeptidyl aminopeptidase/acylaminoacyl peptidase
VFPGANGKIAVVNEFYPPCGDCGPGERIWILAPGRLVARADNGWNPAFSPSGARIAYETDHGIVVRRQDGSEPTSREWLTDPIWSPKGDELAYRGPSGRVGVMQANGKNRRRLPIRAPFAWAPNGKELAWIDRAPPSIQAIGSDRRGRREIGALDQSTPRPAELIWLRSGWLAYRRDGPLADETQLFIRRPGAAERLLVAGVAQNTYDETFVLLRPDTYSWSPDGRRVAFLRDGGLWAATVPEGRERLLVPPGQAGDLPQWSPDGRLIAFVRGHRVMTVPAGGGRQRLFARFPGSGVAVDIDWQRRPG